MRPETIRAVERDALALALAGAPEAAKALRAYQPSPEHRALWRAFLAADEAGEVTLDTVTAHASGDRAALGALAEVVAHLPRSAPARVADSLAVVARSIEAERSIADARLELDGAQRALASGEVASALAVIDRVAARLAPPPVKPKAPPWLAGWGLMPGEWLDTPPPPREWLLTRDGVPVLARGVVGMLVGRGGMGKSHSLTQLAIAFCAGRRWLDTFDVTDVPGKVVLALAEEDPAEVRRRVYAACAIANLTARELELVRSRLVVLGLAGHRVALVSGGDEIAPTANHAAMLERLAAEPHPLVLLDPLTRWAPGVEGDNDCATAAVQILEQLAHAARGTVIVAHHTSKASRREGESNATDGARGVTGLTDGTRWVAVLESKSDTEGDLTLSVTKTNYAPPVAPVPLIRDTQTGALRAPSSLDVDERKAARARSEREAQDTLEAITLQVVRDQPGIGLAARSAEVRRIAGKATNDRIDAAVRALVSAGEVADDRHGTTHRYSLAGVCRSLPKAATADGGRLPHPTPPPTGEGTAADEPPPSGQLPFAESRSAGKRQTDPNEWGAP